MRKHLAMGSIAALGAVAGLTGAWASDAKPQLVVLRGAAQVEQANGTWQESNSIPIGSWVRSSKSETTLRLPGLTMRMEPGATVRVSKSTGLSNQLEAKGGRVFVKVDAKSSCDVSLPTRTVQASESEFVVDPKGRLFVLNGQASLLNVRAPLQTLPGWSKELGGRVALDGPDVRKRNQNRKRFTQGEENKGKRIGEDLPPSNSPTPAQSPAYTPSPTATATPPSTPPTSSPPTSNPPTATGGGGEIWPYAVAAAVVGAGTYLLVNNDDDDDQVFVNNPASP